MRRRHDETGPASPQVLYVLIALLDGARHGYGIMQDVESRTEGAVTLLPTSLYATIKRILAEGLVEEAGAVAGGPGRPRREYQITDAGRQVVERELGRMTALLDLARQKDAALVDRASGRSR